MHSPAFDRDVCSGQLVFGSREARHHDGQRTRASVEDLAERQRRSRIQPVDVVDEQDHLPLALTSDDAAGRPRKRGARLIPSRRPVAPRTGPFEDRSNPRCRGGRCGLAADRLESEPCRFDWCREIEERHHQVA
jgi:hypothetical protein